MSPEAVLAAMLALGGYQPDAGMPIEERVTLYRPTVAAIVAAARTDEEAAALVALGWHESRFARYVLEDRCQDGPKGARCDEGRARGPWQVWGRWCRAVDRASEARCALATLRLGKQRCASWEGGFAALAGHPSCEWPGARKRVQTMRRVLAELPRVRGRGNEGQ